MNNKEMKPAIVFPFNDPEGLMFRHLKAITPLLKKTFSEAYLSITSDTNTRSPKNVSQLERDGFFRLFFLPTDVSVGKHFLSLYEHAAYSSYPDKILHLCFIDRLAFALQTSHQNQFIEDVNSINSERTPLIFQRSKKAWCTHPRNYYEIERFATTIGELILGKSLDFAWCHLVIRSSLLKSILPNVHNNDMSMMAELILLARNNINTQDVDWLEWEDPFFLSCDAADLKRIREESIQETQKRLSYVMPMVQKIIEQSSQHTK